MIKKVDFMKKLFAGMLICLSFLMLSGCFAKTNSPEEVAAKYLSGMVENNYDIMDKYSVVKMEKIVKPIVEEIMRDNSMTEAEVYEMILDGEEVKKMPKNFEEYKKVNREVVRKKLEEEYGKNYSLKVSIISSTDIIGEDKADWLEETSDYCDRYYNIAISDVVDLSKIKEIKKIQCKAYFSGTKETTEDFSIYVVKINKPENVNCK